MKPLLAFQRGIGRDDRGRLRSDILSADDDWLESTHDFIQWLFPLPEPSAANPGAPLADAEVREAFRTDPRLREHLRESFLRMLRFYGLMLDEDGGVRPAPNWAQRNAWFRHGGHNDLRVTRILRSLTVLGLGDPARALLDALERLRASERCGVNARAFDYWRTAVEAAR
ncbi:MAG: hypothetical protein LT102_10195 [Burkholderiaceae bacterium]|nr:hypothetical protein [Burkholderiaceae bacterium]